MDEKIFSQDGPYPIAVAPCLCGRRKLKMREVKHLTSQGPVRCFRCICRCGMEGGASLTRHGAVLIWNRVRREAHRALYPNAPHRQV